jgi:hypothetical protein
MAETIDDITCTWEDNGTLTIEELDKVILSRGAWTTILFKYRELKRDGSWSGAKFSIRRYKKRGGSFWQQSKFNISSVAQAQLIVDALSRWIAEGGDGDGDDDEG